MYRGHLRQGELNTLRVGVWDRESRLCRVPVKGDLDVALRTGLAVDLDAVALGPGAGLEVERDGRRARRAVAPDLSARVHTDVFVAVKGLEALSVGFIWQGGFDSSWAVSHFFTCSAVSAKVVFVGWFRPKNTT